jgi:hypothetical protein
MYLSNVLDSFVNQSTNIYKIVISFSIKDPRYVDHSFLYTYREKYKNSFDIHIQSIDEYDFGPNNKIIGAIKYIKNNEITDDYCLLICDDDLIYNKDLLLSYREMLHDNKNIVYTNFKTINPRIKNIVSHVQGADTYTLPKIFFQKINLEDYINYLQLSLRECPDIFYQDDYVISFYLHKYAGIDVKCVKQTKSYNESNILKNAEQLHLHKQINERECAVLKYFNTKI